MRMPRLKLTETTAVYHCISRIVGGQLLLGDLEKEQFRLLELLPKYIDYVRENTGDAHKHHPDAYHEAFAHISTKIGSTLADISARGLSKATSDQLIRTTKLEEQLVTLENIVHRLAVQMLDEHDSPRAG